MTVIFLSSPNFTEHVSVMPLTRLTSLNQGFLNSCKSANGNKMILKTIFFTKIRHVQFVSCSNFRVRSSLISQIMCESFVFCIVIIIIYLESHVNYVKNLDGCTTMEAHINSSNRYMISSPANLRTVIILA